MAEELNLDGLEEQLDEVTRYILIAVDPTDGGLILDISGWDGTEAIGPLTSVLDKLRADSLDQWDEEE